MEKLLFLRTRIVYERNFILNLRNSPLSRTPPKNFDTFPDTMVNGVSNGKAIKPNNENCKKLNSSGDQKEKTDSSVDDTQEQFQMDIVHEMLKKSVCFSTDVDLQLI
ncbi:eukaryotic translation initiation factor 4E-binding protein, putative [Pediculus humanus corporis]|uniref:Eukaryotic translation initiation factor 4E-binding protein, putative n=1 Tax=Pediculus humanus subsp. corporis TaxID=121224 RepID=E0VKT5_PEDHC|nr:eukaryotic translation initiation factor 4E-binding protein, putative [Pediculus humanus corporis]EEB13991.1 eukaryotic translation initiation factor 4E-binding protein, putative [Pediculus humanus corporis]